MTDKSVNYTAEQTVALVNDYKAGTTVEALAAAFGKSVKSVVAKLSREGVYKTKEKATSATRMTKAALVEYAEDLLQLERGKLGSFQKADKAALEALAAALTSLAN